MNRVALLVLGLFVSIGVGLKSGAARAADDKAEGKGTIVDLGGLQARAPGDWKAEAPTGPFREHQFRLPKVNGDKQDALLVVFYLGTGRSGSNAENIKRQQNLFIAPQGKTIEEATKVETSKVGDVPVTFVDIHGTYKDKKGPMVPDDQAIKRPDYRMLYVIFETAKAPYYLRLVGPAKTVAHHKKGFDAWLKSFK
jgi:gluconolactonase